jgi:transposase IS116/IS110/IS902 family protein
MKNGADLGRTGSTLPLTGLPRSLPESEANSYEQLQIALERRTLRPELLAESRKHKAAKLLRQIPCIGPIRAARLLALMQTPHRFRCIGFRRPMSRTGHGGRNIGINSLESRL